MTLQERLENWDDQLAVETDNRLVLNVALAGQLSRNGYQYTEESLLAAVHLYDNKPVFLDHAASRGRPLDRSTRDLVGSITNPRYVSGRIRGDIRVLASESGDLFLNLVQSQTPGVGMSHVVLAERSLDGKLVQRISEVVSVDVVVNPATTQTFSESLTPNLESPAASAAAVSCEYCSACQVRQEQADQLQTECHVLREDVRRLQLELRGHQEQVAVQRLIASSGLPTESITECFQQQLLSASTPEARRQLLQDRAQLMASGRRPVRLAGSSERSLSSGQKLVDDEFVRVLKRRSR